MKYQIKTTARSLALLGVLCGAVGSASAASLINAAGTVALGVNPAGHLNVLDPYGLAPNSLPDLGIAYLDPAYAPPPPYPGGTAGDATAPGCRCEGWGVSANGTDSGYANRDTDGGVINLTVDSFATDDDGLSGPGSYATSKVYVTSLPGLEVTQAYSLSAATDNAFENLVTIKNTTGGTLTDVKYVRVMDWDIPPTEFNEFVTISGTATTTELEKSHNNGFNTANPLSDFGPRDLATVDADFADNGPDDHGAYFRFNFGDLADGESKSFKVFYGAGKDETEALAALAALAPELYSLGQSNDGSGNANNGSYTYFFAFKGVGGVVITPPPPGVPDGGATFGMLGLGLAGLGLCRNWVRRKA